MYIIVGVLHNTSGVFFKGSLVQLNKNATVQVVCHVRCIILCTFVICTTYKTNWSMRTIRGTGEPNDFRIPQTVSRLYCPTACATPSFALIILE